jgi:carbonic anhydrase
MSTTEEVLKANEDYARNFRLGHLTIPPARRLAIVACMDARLSVEQFAGLNTGGRPYHPQCRRRGDR